MTATYAPSPDSPSEASGRIAGLGRLVTILPFAVALLVGGWFAWNVVSNQREESSAYERAEAALAAGDYDGAVDAFAQAGNYRDAPDRRMQTQQLLAPVRTAYLDAITAIELGDFDVAIALLEPIQETMPGFQDVTALLEEATTERQRSLERDTTIAIAHRDWMAADASLVQLTTLHPENDHYRDQLMELRAKHAPILFVRSGKLLQIGPDGADERLLFDEFPVTSPQWSPDRHFITFFDGNAGRSPTATLYLFEYATGSVETIASHAAPEPFMAWNADGTKLAFVVSNGEESGNGTELAVFDLRSRSMGKTPLSEYAEELPHLRVFSPTWAPDGSRLAVVAQYQSAESSGQSAGRRADVLVIDFDTAQVTNLTQGTLPVVSYITWSPVRDELLAWESMDGAAWFDSPETTIWLVNVATRKAERLTLRTETTGLPSWSPDGGSFAVIVGGQTLLIRSLEGTVLFESTSSWRLTGQITWSPSGNAILAIAKVPSEPSILFQVDSVDGAAQPLMLEFDGHWPNLGPQWSAG